MDHLFRNKFWLAILLTIFVVCCWRVVGFAWQFGHDSLQMDFAAFYTAGEARALGLSPYVNHLDREPPVWDGVALLRHSRFLYPPIVARLFQPLSWLPYGWAKLVWTGLVLACLGGALLLVWKTMRLPSSFHHILFFGICACVFHPVLTLLERGQIDAWTFLLIVLFIVSTRQEKKQQLLGGGSLALAVLLKLHCIYLVPFMVLRKKWYSLIGFVAGLLLCITASVVFEGYDLNREYVVEHLPRIARYGEGGTPNQMMPRSAIEPYLSDLRSGYTIKDGIRYVQVAFQFVASATLVDVFAPPTLGASASADSSKVSLVLFVVFMGAIVVCRLMKPNMFLCKDAFSDWVYWQTAMVVVLLCSPTTWVMNVVWVLPAVAILIGRYQQSDLGDVWPVYLLCLGVLIAGMPDHYSFSVFLPYMQSLLDFKYVVAESLLFVALMWLLFRLQETSKNSPKGLAT